VSNTSNTSTLWEKIEEVNAQLLEDEPINLTVYKDECGYTVQHLLDTVNAILGPENWTMVVKDAGSFEAGKVDAMMVRVAVGMSAGGMSAGGGITMTWREAYGSANDARNNEADAYKGAIADATKKALSMFGIGRRIYRGEVTSDVIDAFNDYKDQKKQGYNTPGLTKEKASVRRRKAQEADARADAGAPDPPKQPAKADEPRTHPYPRNTQWEGTLPENERKAVVNLMREMVLHANGEAHFGSTAEDAKRRVASWLEGLGFPAMTLRELPETCEDGNGNRMRVYDLLHEDLERIREEIIEMNKSTGMQRHEMVNGSTRVTLAPEHTSPLATKKPWGGNKEG
jgi:hypothetical protein